MGEEVLEKGLKRSGRAGSWGMGRFAKPGEEPPRKEHMGREAIT